jgi:hypothetical protein
MLLTLYAVTAAAARRGAIPASAVLIALRSA